MAKHDAQANQPDDAEDILRRPDHDPAERQPGPEHVGYTNEVVDRRSGLDRRDVARRRAEDATDTATDTDTGADADADTDDRQRAAFTGLERRRGPGRRRTDFTRQAEEGEMTPEQFLFLMAIDAFKRANHKTFPSWTDVLEVIRLLGYRKTQHSQLNLPGAEDWTEKPDTPPGVREKPGDRE